MEAMDKSYNIYGMSGLAAWLLLTVLALVSCGDQQEGIDVYTTAKGKRVTITPIKHASLQINYDGREFEIDPVCSNVMPVVEYLDKPKADFILVTHGHSDHWDSYACHVMMQRYTELIVPKSIWQKLRKGNVMENNMTMDIGHGCTIDAVPAYNTSRKKLKAHPKGRDNGYLLDLEGFRIYIAGDTEPIPEMKDLGKVDIAFLPVSRSTMTLKQLRQAIQTIKPRVVYPYHFGKTDTAKIRQYASGLGAEVKIRYLR